MPIFDYKCKCGAKKNNNLVKKYDDVVTCGVCNEPMQKLINYAPAVHGLVDNNYTTNEDDVGEILDNSQF